MSAASLRCHRAAAAAALVAFLVACTEGVRVRPAEAIQQHEFYQDTMQLQLTSGEQFKTKRMTVTDSTVTVYILKKRWGSKELDPPLVIPMKEIETIERMELDMSHTVASLVTLGLIVFVIWIFEDYDFGS